MEECIGKVDNLYKGSITAQLIDPVTGDITQESKIDNAVMNFTDKQWKQVQKMAWMMNLPDGQAGGFNHGPYPFFPNTHLILTDDSSVPDPDNAYINGKLLVGAARAGLNTNSLGNLKPTLCKRSRNQARWVYEWSPLEANGTFQSVSWASMSGSQIIAGTIAEIADEVAQISGTKTFYDGSQYIYHWYQEGTNLLNQLWFARTDINTKLKTNLFQVPSALSGLGSTFYTYYEITVFNNYILLNSGSNAVILNFSGEMLVRGGTNPNYTYSFSPSTYTILSVNVISGGRIYYLNGRLVSIYSSASYQNYTTMYATGDISTDWSGLNIYTYNNYPETGLGTIWSRFNVSQDGNYLWIYYNNAGLTVSPWQQIMAQKYSFSYATTNGGAITATVVDTVYKGRDYIYGSNGLMNTRAIPPISTTFSVDVYNYTSYIYGQTSSDTMNLYEMRYKSNVSGYDLLGFDYHVNPYSADNGIVYNTVEMHGTNIWNPDIVSTRALLPSPFTKTSANTLRITYDINFE